MGQRLLRLDEGVLATTSRIRYLSCIPKDECLMISSAFRGIHTARYGMAWNGMAWYSYILVSSITFLSVQEVANQVSQLLLFDAWLKASAARN
mmetsp:Transcript_26243/g.72066  ORF Transcript_26243/g.72066 Transcript_26243/m.72066 type:complete len:93 (+) Transcript_26243:1560-1838(+)